MDFLREIVGGPKNRYKENGYNLDFTYITSRIVAMAFPASGFQKLYRNNIDTIAQLLANEHQNKYITINISGRGIDEGVLKNVVSYQWEDHKAPPFDTLFNICDRVADFLAEDEDRIAVFHCNHGKGRTGTIICCFFLFMGVFQNYKEVMQFYAKRRFQREGYGVTQPCQIQYIQYFQQYLCNPALYPQVLSIKKIVFRGGFRFNSPYVKIRSNTTGKVIYNTRDSDNTLQIDKDNEYVLRLTKPHSFVGDITLQIKENNPLGKNLLISYVFNSAFVDFGKQGVAFLRTDRVPLASLSPLGKQKLANFSPDFEMDVEFRRVCKCGETKNIGGCDKCQGLLQQEFTRWEAISAACKNRQLLLGKAQTICFGVQ